MLTKVIRGLLFRPSHTSLAAIVRILARDSCQSAKEFPLLQVHRIFPQIQDVGMPICSMPGRCFVRRMIPIERVKKKESQLLEEGLQRLVDDFKEGCPVEAVRLPRGLTTIGDAAFYGAKLEQLVVPDSVTRIGAHAFGGNRLKTLEQLKELTLVGERAFAENPARLLT